MHLPCIQLSKLIKLFPMLLKNCGTVDYLNNHFSVASCAPMPYICGCFYPRSQQSSNYAQFFEFLTKSLAGCVKKILSLNIKSSILWNQWRLRVINQPRTRLITEGSSLTLVTHSLYNTWSHHSYLSQNENDSDRFVSFTTICWSSPSNPKRSDRFTLLRGAAVAAVWTWMEARKKV